MRLINALLVLPFLAGAVACNNGGASCDAACERVNDCFDNLDCAATCDAAPNQESEEPRCEGAVNEYYSCLSDTSNSCADIQDGVCDSRLDDISEECTGSGGGIGNVCERATAIVRDCDWFEECEDDPDTSEDECDPGQCIGVDACGAQCIVDATSDVCDVEDDLIECLEDC